MGLISRVFHGAIQAAGSVGRAAFTPFTAAWDQAKTTLHSMKTLVTQGPIAAGKEFVAGTASNAARAGVNIAEGAYPAIGFAEGFLRDKSNATDIAKTVVTKIV
jgi:hypothetical protein